MSEEKEPYLSIPESFNNKWSDLTELQKQWIQNEFNRLKRANPPQFTIVTPNNVHIRLKRYTAGSKPFYLIENIE